MSAERIEKEQHRVSGDRLLAKVREIVHQDNIRRIIVKNDDGRVLIEIPLTLGVVGALLVPVWVALGAMAALVANFNIEVEKVGDAPQAIEPPTEAKREDAAFTANS